MPALLAFLLLCLPLITFAQEGFVPLVGVPFIDNVDVGRTASTRLAGYANAFYIAAISLGAVVAVLKIIWAGVKYMLSDVITDKTQAKADIKGALLGLILIIGAVLMLNTISPNITALQAFNLTALRIDRPVMVPNPGITTPFDPEVLGTSINWTNATEAERSAFRDNCTGSVNITTNSAGDSIGTCVVNPDAPVDPDLVAETQFNTNIDDNLLNTFELRLDQISQDVGVTLTAADLRGMVAVPMDEIPGDDELAFAVTLQPACESVGGSHIGITGYGGNYEFWCVGQVAN